MKYLALLVTLPLLLVLLSSCTPERGSREWCEMMDKKPKGEWSANDAAEYTKSCIFRRSEK